MREPTRKLLDDTDRPLIIEIGAWRGQVRGTRYSTDDGRVQVTVSANEVVITETREKNDDDRGGEIAGNSDDLAAWAMLCGAWRSVRMGLACIQLGYRSAKFGYGRPYVYAAPKRRPVQIPAGNARTQELDEKHEALAFIEPIEEQLGPFRVSGDIITGKAHERHAIVVETARWWALAARGDLVICTGTPKRGAAVRLLRKLGQVGDERKPTQWIGLDTWSASVLETAAYAEARRTP